jgi:hypothetical protein
MIGLIDDEIQAQILAEIRQTTEKKLLKLLKDYHIEAGSDIRGLTNARQQRIGRLLSRPQFTEITGVAFERVGGGESTVNDPDDASLLLLKNRQPSSHVRKKKPRLAKPKRPTKAKRTKITVPAALDIPVAGASLQAMQTEPLEKITDEPRVEPPVDDSMNDVEELTEDFGHSSIGETKGDNDEVIATKIRARVDQLIQQARSASSEDEKKTLFLEWIAYSKYTGPRNIPIPAFSVPFRVPMVV